MLRKLLFLSLFPTLLFSCDKTDDVNTGLSIPTCEDSTNDGRFEAFNAPETSHFLNFYDEVPDAEIAGSIDTIRLTSRRLINEDQSFEPALIYSQLRPGIMWAYLSYGDNQFYSWMRESLIAADSMQISVYNARNLALTPGCYRLYYVFSDTGYHRVFTKGHYDIQVRKF